MIILLIAIVAILLYVGGFFNNLKTTQVRIGASIQEIGNQLKRQADLIPNLVESAKSYLKHEKDIYKDLTDARKSVDEAVSSNDLGKIEKSQKMVNKVLEGLKVIVESNPELKSAEVITGLMDELRDTADKLMYSRRTLIDLTADYNTAISTIPGLWIAPLLGFQPEKGLSTPTSGKFLEVSENDTVTPKVNL
jgi:LemA protein